MSNRSGGGFPAIQYALRVADQVGWGRLWRTLTSKNACKTCAVGMGGQQGGMRNELGRWPEVCKKSLQAIAADLQPGIPASLFRDTGFDQFAKMSPRELESLGRLTTPLVAGPGDDRYRTSSYNDALERIADTLKVVDPQEAFFYVSGRSSNEAGFLLQLFARLYGTNHVNNCSYYCHQASGVGLSESLGSGTATVVLEDVEHADLVFLIGGNPASNHPRLMRTLVHVRRRGGHVVVMNPVVEPGLVNFRVPSDVRSLVFGSEIASEYVQPHIGGDVAVLTGVAKVLIESGGVHRAFVDGHTEGWAEYEAMVRDTSWPEIVRAGGVDKATIEKVADRYVAAKNVIFAWTMGITHHLHGTENVQTIVNLALLRGMVGRSGAGLLPIRGHSNVQGIGSVGVTPKLKDAIFSRLQSEFGLTLTESTGYDTMQCMEAAERGDIKLAFCLGGNLYGANPDAAFARRALSNVETVVYLSTTLNTGHVHGRGKETIVLPVLARDEEPQPTTQESMFNYLRLSDGGRPRHVGPRSEVSVIATIAQRLFEQNGPIDWRGFKRHATIRQWIGRVVPGYERIGDIDETKQEFHIAGRTFHTPQFSTPSGKAQFAAHPIPHTERVNGTLRLMTVRSEGQFNTVVYEEEDIYRGQTRRDVVLMHAQDMQERGIAEGQRVTVHNDVGAMSDIIARAHDIRAGNVLMYYPESNVLVPTAVDPRSKTPAFKSVAVQIEPA